MPRTGRRGRQGIRHPPYAPLAFDRASDARSWPMTVSRREQAGSRGDAGRAGDHHPAGRADACETAVATHRMVVGGALVRTESVLAVAGNRLLVTFDGGQLAGVAGELTVTVTGQLRESVLVAVCDRVMQAVTVPIV